MKSETRHVLLAVDPHKSTHEILLYARQLVGKEDVVLHLIHVAQHMHSPGLRYRLSKDRRDLERLAKLYNLPIATIKVRVGDRKQVLAEEASLLNADILAFPRKLYKQHNSLLQHLAAMPA